MSEDEKIRYFQQLQINYRNAGQQSKGVYVSRQYMPVEYRYIERPAKERGYGCTNCIIF